MPAAIESDTYESDMHVAAPVGGRYWPRRQAQSAELGRTRRGQPYDKSRKVRRALWFRPLGALGLACARRASPSAVGVRSDRT